MAERRPSKPPPKRSAFTLPGLAAPTLRGLSATGESGATDTLPSTPLHQILKEMRKVRARDPLMELVLIAARPFAPKSALFAVKKDAFVGKMCTSNFGDRTLFAEVSIPSNAPSVLATVAAGGVYVGPLVRSEAHAPLFRFIKAKAPEVLVAPIRAGGKAAIVFLAHEIGETLKIEPTISEVLRVAGETLEEILRARPNHA